jgi:hypothetical protein
MQLQIPICSFDAKTGILCSMCESRLRSGQIREADVQASKALLQLAGHLRGAASLVRSFRVDGNYILELDQAGLLAFRNSPETLTELEELLGGRVWLSRASSSNREFIEDMLHPVKVLSLGTVWLPDGAKLAKAVVAGRIGRRTHPLELVRRIAKEVRGIDLVVESDFENQFPDRASGRNFSQQGSHDRLPAPGQATEVRGPTLEVTGATLSRPTHDEDATPALTRAGHTLSPANQGER